MHPEQVRLAGVQGLCKARQIQNTRDNCQSWQPAKKHVQFNPAEKKKKILSRSPTALNASLFISAKVVCAPVLIVLHFAQCWQHFASSNHVWADT